MTAHAAIYVGCKQLGIEEEDRRDLYERVTGKRALTEMTYKQRNDIVLELQRLGFKKVSKPSQKGLQGKYAKKLQALWIAAWNLGLIKNKNDKALLAFVKRQTGVDHTRFLKHPADANKAIEALKSWLTREGGVDWSVDEFMHDYQRMAGYKIAIAQYCKLYDGWQQNSFKDFIGHVRQYSKLSNLDLFKEADWIPVMNALGAQIRAQK